MNRSCDTRLSARWQGSPNFHPRRNGLQPNILLMHYTGMESAGAALDLLCDERSGVSCHYLVEESGQIVQMVREDQRAWHAGHSHWRGEDDVNSCSIGIEIVNEGHDPVPHPFPEQQIRAVTGLALDIIERHAIPARNIIGHSDVAPARKKDPGELFPWKILHESGIGHFVDPVPPKGDRGAGPGDEGEKVALAQQMLRRYGYQIATTGLYDEAMSCVVTAFQRHFRPEKIDGRLDVSTRHTLENLVNSLPSRSTA